MSAVAMQSFGFGDQLVRVIDRDGAVWFVANDVCASLEIGNSRQAVSRLDEDEKGVITADTLGGQQQLTIISESGVYSLIFTSRKASAKQFRKWVTQEVLPTIRTTGRFELAPAEPDEDAIGFEVPDQFDTLSKKLALAREARVVFGIKAARVAWRELGLLPALTDGLLSPREEMIAAARAVAPVNATVADWMSARVDYVPGHREQCQTLYYDYVDWCRSTKVVPDATVTLTAFGRALTNAGVIGIKTNRRHRVGLKLKQE